MPEVLRYGEEQFEGTPISRLRRNELHKIAKAHDIPVRPHCNKKKILPIIEEAVSEGRIDPDYLLKGAKYPHFITGGPAPITPGKMMVDINNDVHILSDEPLTTVHLGNAMKWCVMQGDTILHKGLKTKEEADGIYIPASG